MGIIFLPPNSFAYVFVESGYAAGILNGFDANTCAQFNVQFPCYRPALPITRGQLTKLVVNAAHLPSFTSTSGQTFNDVPPNSVFYSYIEAAHHAGVINGYLDGTFRPNNVIRRDEMAQIVYTAQQVAPPTSTPAPASNTPTPLLATETATSLPPTETATPLPPSDTPTLTLTPSR